MAWKQDTGEREFDWGQRASSHSVSGWCKGLIQLSKINNITSLNEVQPTPESWGWTKQCVSMRKQVIRTCLGSLEESNRSMKAWKRLCAFLRCLSDNGIAHPHIPPHALLVGTVSHSFLPAPLACYRAAPPSRSGSQPAPGPVVAMTTSPPPPLPLFWLCGPKVMAVSDRRRVSDRVKELTNYTLLLRSDVDFLPELVLHTFAFIVPSWRLCECQRPCMSTSSDSWPQRWRSSPQVHSQFGFSLELAFIMHESKYLLLPETFREHIYLGLNISPATTWHTTHTFPNIKPAGWSLSSSQSVVWGCHWQQWHRNPAGCKKNRHQVKLSFIFSHDYWSYIKIILSTWAEVVTLQHRKPVVLPGGCRGL